MKQQIMAVIIAVVLLMSLAGCSTTPSGTDSPKGGTVYIQVNPEIAVTYDADGTVTSVTAVTEDARQIVAQYQDFSGKACSDVVVELVTMIGEAGYLSDDTGEVTISIRFGENSSIPNEDFLTSVEQQVQTVVQDRQWQGTVAVISPTESENTTEPSGPDLPEGAVLQSDGTYLLTQYTSKSDNPVEKDDPNVKYILKTVYDSDGRITGKTKEHASYSLLLAGDWWEYSEEGALISYTKQRFDNGGVMEEHYREDYNSSGQLTLTTKYGHDGTVDCILAYEYHSNGKCKTETTTNESGTLLAHKEYSQSGSLTLDSTYYSDGSEKSRAVYAEDGTPVEAYRWYSDGTTEFQEEYFANGRPKAHKMWYEDGILRREFTAFTDENTDNGILAEYDRSGKPTSRYTTGNPDGSYDTQESWDRDGTHYLFAFSGDLLAEERYTYPDGGTLVITYDHTTDTKHVLRQTSKDTFDIIRSISSDAPIEGYMESILDGGNIHRTEWKDGYKSKEISDGWPNMNGYAYRGTTCYYPNGQVKSAEQYFYADGGRVYFEYDENGNETHSEDTTKCND